MACDLQTVQEDACLSGIGTLTDPIKLLQVIAQLQAEILQEASPGIEISPEAILERACTSGIGKVTDNLMLNKLIAQLLCDSA
jgi:hypothetical protein